MVVDRDQSTEKLKSALEQAVKVQRGIRGIPLLFL
jgi:hypothetical protein